MIAERRTEMGLSLRELGVRADVSYESVRHIESSNRIPRHDALLRICAALGLPPQQVLFDLHRRQYESAIAKESAQ